MRGPESSSGLLGSTGWLGAQEEAVRAGGAETGPEGAGRAQGLSLPGVGLGDTARASSSSFLQFRDVLV